MSAPEAFDSSLSQGLLSALLDFTKPYVHECVTSPSFMNNELQNNAGHLESAEQRLLNGLKGVMALEVSRISAKHTEPSNDTNALSPVTVKAHTTVDDDALLKKLLLDGIRSRVLKMPTRLLAFDSHGENIHLIEQREAIKHLEGVVFAAACKPDFQAEWGKLHMWQRDQKAHLVDSFLGRHAGYTILSHTWTKDVSGEVLFHNWATRWKNTAGNAKINNFCKVSAQKHGYTLGWIDTACINKESSAELDEAIRSMYKWYRNASTCVIFLAETRDCSDLSSDSWFRRGWTLQELVAPRSISCYNADWNSMDTSEGHSIIARVCAAASITEAEMDLFRCGKPDNIPISRKLQMASNRQVTREEDSAYSLMGLLDVSISIAYGEGADRAFLRLMRELLNTKKNILDVFNHTYTSVSDTIIPKNVYVYSSRSTVFDIQHSDKTSELRHDGITSLLDKWTPSRPLLLTHIGLRMDLLLVPGFAPPSLDMTSLPFENSDIDPTPSFSPQGHFFGHFFHYQLLNRKLYSMPKTASPSYVSLVAITGDVRIPSVLVLAVVNFGSLNDEVVLPDSCLAIPLDCGMGRPGHIQPSDHVKVYPLDSISYNKPVPVFQLKSNKGAENIIPHSRLKSHGLQLLTLYL